MSLRDELRVALDEQGVAWNDLKIDKDADYKGRSATHVGFIINGDNGPVFFDTTFADDLKLPDTKHAELIAKNAAHAYANHFWHEREVEQ